MFPVSVIKAVDKAAEAERDAARTHLGASVLGNACARAIWYGWRWAHLTQHSGRILRLFDRGRREEPDILARLSQAGFDVRPFAQRLCFHPQVAPPYALTEWDAPVPEGMVDVTLSPGHIEIAAEMGVRPRQDRFAEVNGHVGGSGDGSIAGPGLPEGRGLLEFKTHGEKSFIDIAGKLVDWRKHVTAPDKSPFTGKGLLSSKPQHYIQMQLYMNQLGYSWGLYVAICKNTDDLYVEIIYAKPEVAAAHLDRARSIVAARVAPPKVTNDPAWFVCKFCDYREICHHDKLPQKNCRSCVYARPCLEEDGRGGWYCDRWHADLPKDFMPKGCDDWDPII